MGILTSQTEVYAQILGAALGYLLGSMPSGMLQTKALPLWGARTADVASTGATEALFFDVIKSAMAVLIAYWLAYAFNDGDTSTDISQEFSVWFAAGIAVFLGHLFPVWRGFKGGKGYGTYLGVLIGWWWPAALASYITWLIVAGVKRYSSLAPLLAAVVALLLFYLSTQPLLLTTSMKVLELHRQHEVLTWATALRATVIVWKHRDDIKGLLTSAEQKIRTRN